MASSTTRAPPFFLPSMIMLSLLLLLLLASFSHADSAAPNTVVCSEHVYSDDAPFAVSVAEVLKELVWVTPWGGGHDLYQSLPSEAPIAYGHAVCRPGLIGVDCKSCLGYAVTQVQQVCGHSLGGRAAMGDDCSVRYENYAFRD
ncbi:unnamed protein product [Urochloa decumbens]|uniref:Gnk2-homologous domain-containing protein n=1 Tax=Urochloa decumbens TaxID=240449 RepID=A0ABC9BQW2_9POAL